MRLFLVAVKEGGAATHLWALMGCRRGDARAKAGLPLQLRYMSKQGGDLPLK